MQENRPNWNKLLNHLLKDTKKIDVLYIAKDLYHTWFKNETISNTGLHRKGLKNE